MPEAKRATTDGPGGVRRMVIGILQPAYLPWLGFFEQIQRVDAFVILDDVQHTKQDWRTRNRIRAGVDEGFAYLTVPVKKAPVETLVKDVLVAYDQKWIPKHLNLLRANYARAPHFEEHFQGLRQVLETRPERLVELDMRLTEYLARAFGLSTPTLFSSQYDVPGRKTEKLINLCQAVGATDLYDGWSAQNFIDPEDFRAANLGLHYQKYTPVEYPQQYAPFLPFLSAVDALFNCGPACPAIIRRGAEVFTAVPSPVALEGVGTGLVSRGV